MRSWAVPAVPFALSLLLSLASVGSHPFWQDSGVYLTAVKELGVLYAPGFVLYEVLCKAWTLLFFFLDFTLAVHLFSSVCAAGAAAAVAVAVRDLLRSRGPVFRVTSEDPGALADDCGIVAGTLLAGGFTFWSTAIYAKGYAFSFLILALLLWRMIRADDRGRPRDWTIVAALIGLAWQAHPSAALLGPALLLFVGFHARRLGWKGVGGRVLVAAACALGPSLVLLPLLIARDPWLMFNRPDTAGEFLRFVTGGRFAAVHGGFGLDATRVASVFRYAWEDLLGVGLAFVALGLAGIVRRNNRLLLWIATWVLPFTVLTVLFKMEGQHDCWFVAARLPLFLAAGVGAWELGLLAKANGGLVLRAAAAVATVWAVLANYGDVQQRDYRAAELYGRTILETADPDAILILSGDDSNGLAAYLQRVRGVRPDVILVTASFLNSEETTASTWYDDALLRRHPDLKRPDYAGARSRFPSADRKQLATAAFINANVDGRRTILSEVVVPAPLLRTELTPVPAGVFVKFLPPGVPSGVEARYWSFPIEPEDVRALYRRARGQVVSYDADGVRVRPERYERRLAALILRARFRLALVRFEAQQFADAARLCQSIVDFDDEELSAGPEIVHLLGISYYGAGRTDRAAPALKRSSEIAARPDARATALFYLGEIARKAGDSAAADRYREQALSVPGVDPKVLREMERRP